MNWKELYDQGCETFGERPRAELEQQLIEAFQERPGELEQTITDVGAAVRAGTVRSGWAVVRSRLARDEARANIVSTGNVDRDKRVQQAEQYMRAAGLYLASEDEVLDDLFGDGGRLRAWQGDDELVARMLDLWRSLQPAAERVEAEALERAENWKRGQAALKAPLVPGVPPIDWDAGRLRAYADSGSTMLVS